MILVNRAWTVTRLAAGAYLLLVAGAVATGLTGSSMPMLGTIGAVGLAIWYANLRSKAK
mgnify:CR=1 FL=1